MMHKARDLELQAQGNLVILAPRFPDVRRHPLHKVM
jgi:hypothetical protein